MTAMYSEFYKHESHFEASLKGNDAQECHCCGLTSRYRDVWYPASVRAKIRRNHRLLRQYADCFDAPDCEPLVPLHDVVLAHRFGGGMRQILTLFNPSGTVQRVELPAAGGSITAEVPPQTTRVVLREHGTCILVG